MNVKERESLPVRRREANLKPYEKVTEGGMGKLGFLLLIELSLTFPSNWKLSPPDSK